MKKLFALLLPLLAAVGCLQEERSPEEILVPTPAQMDCSASSFLMTSQVPKGSENLIDDCGFYVGTDNTLSGAAKVKATLTDNKISADLPARDYGTTYYMCSFVTNGHGSEIRSDVRSFKLEELETYVEFGEVNLTSYDLGSQHTEITIDASILAGVEVDEIGVCYGEDKDNLSIEGDHKVGVLSGETRAAGFISIILDGLIDDVQYYLRPYIKDGSYLAYGDVIPFLIPAVPVVYTYDAQDITPQSATLCGKVLKGADISDRGFIYNEGTGGIEDLKYKVSVFGDIGEYTAQLNGLNPNKKYTYCAYTVNPMGTYYGEVKSFMTNVDMPAVTSAVVSSITSTTARFSSSVKNHGGETVTEVGFYYSTEPAVDPATALKVNQPYSQDAFSIDVENLNVYTKYYVMAYATNSAGTTYSDVATFTTDSSYPTVQTVGATDINSQGATLSGSVLSDNGASITERGFVYMQGTGTPTTDSYKLKVSGKTGEYTGSLSGLEPNKKYSFRAYAVNSKGTAYGEVMSFLTVTGLPKVSAVDVSKITATSATITADVTDHGGETVSEVGFYYSQDAAVDVETSVKVTRNYAGGAFSTSLTDLSVFTTYYVKAYAVNSAGVAYSSVVSFKTLADVPVVQTLGSAEVGSDGATLSGTVLTDNGATIKERGFVWMQGDGMPTTSNSKLQTSGTTGDFTATLSGLDPNKKYSFRAYAVNSMGTAYGAVMTFVTSTSLPSLSLVNVSAITSTSATFTANVMNHGGETVSEVGFYYSTDAAVDVNTSVKITKSYAGTAFSAALSDLSINTTYYVKAYAVNSAGTAYSNVVTFKTLASTPVVSTLGSSDVSSSGATLSGSVLTDNGAEITERGFVWMQGDGTPTTDSRKQVVSGTTGDFTVALTALEPNEKYSFRAYAINSVGTSYGAVMTFSTVAGLPVLSSVAVSQITSTSATFKSDVTDHGGETVSEVGFYYSEDESVDVSSAVKVPITYVGGSFTAAISDLSIATTYYVKAYAVNSAGIAYSRVVNFNTLASSPVVTTIGSSDITSSSATLSGTVVTDNGATIKERGFVWVQGDGTPTTSSRKLTASGTTGDFTAALTNLEPNKKYSFRAYAINSVGTSYGDIMTFSTVAGLPVLSSVDVSNITSASATLRSDVTSHGGETVSEVGFYYSLDETVDISTAVKVTKTYTGSAFTATLSDLNVATTYYVKAYAVNSAGTSYSAVASFKTLASTPVVNTVGSSSITSNSAVLSGKVVTDNGSPITQRGFVWLQGEGTPTTSSHKLTVEGTTGDFTADMTGLEPNKKYSFRAYAINSMGTSYGDIMTFVTIAGLPSLSVTRVTDIATTSAVLSCSVTSHGGATVSEVGFYYSTSETLDVTTAQKVSENYSTDNFSFRIQNLEVGTYYYIRAYTKNHVGEVVNDIVNFKTTSSIPTVSTSGSSEVTHNSAHLSGEVLDDNGEPVTECGFVWVKGTSTPTTSSNVIKLEGAVDKISAKVTGLVPDQTYTFRAYAKNSKGKAYGDNMTFTTTKSPGTGEGFTGDEIEW